MSVRHAMNDHPISASPRTTDLARRARLRGYAAPLLLALLAGCGDAFVNPLKNLNRPSVVLAVTDALRTDGSPEWIFILDTDRAQLVLADAKVPALRDLIPELPGFNGALLGGQPTAMAAREDGTEVVIANYGLGLLQIVCTPIAGVACPTTTVVASIEVGDSPEGVTVLGNHAYVTRPHEGVVVSVNLDTRAIDGVFDVGGTPRAVAVSKHAAGDKLWVADGRGTVLHRIRLGATPDIAAIEVGFPTESVNVSPSPQFVYAIRADKGTILVVDPETEQLINVFPDGPPNRGPDLDLPGRALGIAFTTFTAAENRPLGPGQFGWVTCADGFVYGIYTDGRTPHQLVNRSPPPPNDGGVVVCENADAPLPGSGNPNTCPSVVSTPELSLGSTGIAVTLDTPRLIRFDIPPSFGVRFTNGRGVVRNEVWNFTYQGAILGAAPSPALIGEGNRMRSRDVRFTELLREGTTERRIRDGDYVIFVDPPQPADSAFADGGQACANIEFEESGLRRRWTLELIPGSPSELQLRTRDGTTQPPLSLCYTQPSVAYDVRAGDGWVVQATRAGYQGRAQECPRELPDSACAPYEYSNTVLRITLKQGLKDSEPDMRWSFQASDGLVSASISLNLSSSLAGVPRSISASKRPNQFLYVVDEGDESLSIIDPGTPILQQVLR